MSKAVGFIGLGVMGLSMARNLRKGGEEVHVWNRTASRMAALEDEGLKVHPSAKAVGERVGVLIVCVTDGNSVNEVLFGRDGAVTGAEKPDVVVDCSTIAPSEARAIGEQLAKLGIAFLDAPVTGGDIGARNGTLTVMVGGDPERVEAVRGVFAHMSKTFVHVGPIGAGQLTKCVNQLAVAINIAAMTEAIAFAQHAGLDVERTMEIIGSGAAGSWALANYGPRLLKGDLKPGFHARNMLKDLRIVLSESDRYNLPLPVTSLVKELYLALVRSEGDRADELGNHALIELYHRLAG